MFCILQNEWSLYEFYFLNNKKQKDNIYINRKNIHIHMVI